MTDFFADLERQLIDATPRRAQRLRRARQRRFAVLSTILLALVAGGAGLATALGGSDAGTSAGGGPSSTTPALTPTSPSPNAVPRRGAYTVAVLNGTTVPGLARGVANRLQNSKLKIGNVTNASDQRRAFTRVTFTPGHADRALRVARLLELLPGVVSPASARERELAGDEASVIVTVGSDQNSAPIP
jgi:hypothetical protein